MSDLTPVGKVERINITPRLSKEELHRQLCEYGCPKAITDRVLEWITDCRIDNLKLKRWMEGL